MGFDIGEMGVGLCFWVGLGEGVVGMCGCWGNGWNKGGLYNGGNGGFVGG